MNQQKTVHTVHTYNLVPKACQHLIGLFFGLLGPGTDKDTNKIIIIDQSCVLIGKYRAPDRSK